ncbi:single-stranded DNA-binding protein [Micromonospora sp. WMMD882]|uniref:single-stranded DNA-binding protein n=1 Tax=Micromonospora sp. WMMD882 TaxID=3015151 RepID=UPI00248B90A2|nr:single-stranded DNA-binding protein [Micromonospora sp. WMMD882]WBB79574.1 single-stranded DNA-binding protein [Micromonospora sp. WMMD882]
MFDTYVTIVGNVLTAPEWRRTTQSGTLVANFKVASTARRLDRDSGRWVDGNSLRVRVNCWRKLAEGVAASVMVGDPVVVAGRLYTRDWIDDTGNQRTLYELEAVAVGHDLARGRGRFVRNRPSMATSAVEDTEAERRVHGEPTQPVPDDQAPAALDERPLDDDFELPALGAPRRLSGFPVRATDLGPDPFDPATDSEPTDSMPPDSASDGGGLTGWAATGRGLGGRALDGRGEMGEGSDDGSATAVDAYAVGAATGSADELDPLPEEPEQEQEPGTPAEGVDRGVTASGQRGRRGRGRQPVPA